MANEYLQRTLTSSGNRKVFTWSGWIKRQQDAYEMISFSSPNTVNDGLVMFGFNGSGSTGIYLNFYQSGTSRVYEVDEEYRDFGSWLHYQIVVDTTQATEDDRINFYINGVQRSLSVNAGYSAIPQNYLCDNMTAGNQTLIGTGRNSSGTISGYTKLELSDVFFVDGQALTPEVFGFYKEGKGYQSSGSTNATDFRSGQWSPRDPKSIKYEINRRGGFGVNGFYLPMNDSSNFGADFHCTPNSIIKLKGEDLPQPRNGAPDTSDAYVSELRDDPYAANLILAIPFISGGQGNGIGDYSADIKGSGTNKTVTRNGSFAVGECASHYGSALKGSSGNRWVEVAANSDFANLYDVDHTIEFWYKNDAWTGAYLPHNDIMGLNVSGTTDTAWRITFTDKNIGDQIEDGIELFGDTSFSTGPQILNNDWNHCAIVQEGNNTTIYINGVAQVVGGKHGYAANKASTGPIIIGADPRVNPQDGSTYLYNGQLQDIRIYKGVAKYKGGFDVAKPYTPVGIESWRALPDTTANNFATFNPLMISSNGTNTTYNQYTLTNGNLSAAPTANNHGVSANFSVSSGKWYWEMRVDTFFADNLWMGILDHDFGGSGTVPLPADSNFWISGGNIEINLYGSGGTVYRGSSTTATGTSYAENDIIGFGLDLDTDGNKTPRLTFYKNGIGVHTSTGSMSGNPIGLWRPAITFGGNGTDWLVTANFGQNPTFSHKRAVFGKRVNTGNADSIWHQSSNGGTHTDWTISADGTNLQVTVPTGAYARAYLLASDGTIDPKKRYLVTFDYVTGPANLGVAASNSGGSIQYLTAVDGSASPNGLSSGNSYAFEFQGDQFAITGFNGLTYELDNVIISEIGDAYTDDSGKGKFSYQPPTGFLALCEDNLPTPAIADPGKYFKTVLWTGDGQRGRSITGVGFQPDLVWLKTRTAINDNHKLIDVVRGPTKTIYSNLTQSELTETTGLLSFDTDGFTVGSDSGNNGSGRTFVAWCWKAGGPAVTNNDGTVASQVSVNQDAGFSIVSYTGNGSASATIGHGLGKKPALMIVKERTATSTSGGIWTVYHAQTNRVGFLNLPNAADIISGGTNGSVDIANSTTSIFPFINGSSSVNNWNNSGSNYIAYCWAEIEGFSKFGSFIGNGVVDGPFVYCGFKPAWILIRQTGASQWNILDTSRNSSNPADYTLLANDALVENTPSTRLIDFLSNGFKIRSNSADINANGNTVFFAAFAESPFQSANAK